MIVDPNLLIWLRGVILTADPRNDIADGMPRVAGADVPNNASRGSAPESDAAEDVHDAAPGVDHRTTISEMETMG